MKLSIRETLEFLYAMIGATVAIAVGGVLVLVNYSHFGSVAVVANAILMGTVSGMAIWATCRDIHFLRTSLAE